MKMQVFASLWRLEEPTRLPQNGGRCGSEFRGLNHDFNPEPASDLSLKMIKFKAKVTKLGIFPERDPLRLQIWRKGANSVRSTRSW